MKAAYFFLLALACLCLLLTLGGCTTFEVPKPCQGCQTVTHIQLFQLMRGSHEIGFASGFDQGRTARDFECVRPL